MEHILDIDSKRFIVGLEWIKIAGGDPLLAARTHARSRKSPLSLLRAVEMDEGQLVYQVGLARQKQKSKTVYSAAAHLANLFPSMIAIDRLENDLYWICVSDNGRVLPGHDIAASDSEIRAIFSELQAEYTLDYMRLLMPKDVSSALGLTGFEDISPLAMLEEHEPDSSIQLKNLMGIPNSVYLSIAMAVLMAGGWAYLNHLEAEKARKLQELMEREAAEAAALEAQMAESKKNEITDDDLLSRAREEELLWLRDDFNTLNLMTAMKHMLVTRYELPRSHSGWSLETLSFNKLTKGELISLWKRDSGQLKALNDYFEGRASVSFSPQVDVGRVGLQVNMGSEGIADIESHLKKNGLNYQDIADVLIENKFEFTISVLKQEARKEVIKGLKNKSLESMPQLNMRMRKFEVVGSGKSDYVRLMAALEDAKNMLPDDITFDLVEGKFGWRFTGILYEL